MHTNTASTHIASIVAHGFTLIQAPIREVWVMCYCDYMWHTYSSRLSSA